MPALWRSPPAERIVRAARECEGLELVAIGPLTNLAHALALDPSLPRRVAGLTVMGGHVREVKIGDFVCDPGIDYNLCSDAAASMAGVGRGFRHHPDYSGCHTRDLAAGRGSGRDRSHGRTRCGARPTDSSLECPYNVHCSRASGALWRPTMRRFSMTRSRCCL